MTWTIGLTVAILFIPLLISLYLRNRDISGEAVEQATRPKKPAPYDVGAFALEVREKLSNRKEGHPQEAFLQSGTAEELPSVSDLNIEELNRKAHERRGYSAASLDGGLLYGGSVIQKHMAVDDNIYEGITNMAGEDLV